MANQAILIGAPLLHHETRLLGVANDLATAENLLAGRGFRCQRLYAADANRDAILTLLDDVTGTLGPEDAVALYYSGHGGQVVRTGEVRDLRSSALHPRYHQFLVPEDFHDHDDAFHGILDIELSHAVARMLARTRNVTVILDCCHAGGMARRPDGAVDKGLDPRLFKPRVRQLNHLIRLRLDELRARIQAQGAPQLDADAHPDLVRLEAAHADCTALQISHGGQPRSALTLGWAQADELHRGQPVSWQGLHQTLRARLHGLTRGKQRAWLGGPGHRLPFSLIQAPAPGALALVRQGGALHLRGGSLHGIRPGDRFLVVPAAATRADVDQALAEVRVVEVAPDASRVEIVAASDDTDWPSARAFPAEPRGAWTGVAVHASGAVRAALARCIEAVPSLRLCRPADQPVAVITEVTGSRAGAPRVEIRDHAGRCVSAAVLPGPEAVNIATRLQRAAVLRAQESGRDAHALSTPLELMVQVPAGASTIVGCRHADGRTTRPDAPIEVPAGAEVRCELVNRAPPAQKPPQIVYLTVFHVDVDGRITRRSDQAPSGIALWAGEPCPLEYRPHSEDEPMRLDWPEHMPRTGPGLRSLIVVAGDRQHALPGFETCDLDAYDPTLPPSLLDFTRVRPGAAMTRSRPVRPGPEPVMRYAVLRVDFLVFPPEPS